MRHIIEGFNSRRRRTVSFAIAVLTLVATATIPAAEDSSVLFMTIQVNGSTCNVAVDSGSEFSVLFRNVAVRLKADLLPTDNSINCTVGIGNLLTQNQEFVVIDSAPPAGVVFDGILGWDQLSKLILEFDWDDKRVKIHEKVPEYTARWRSAKIRKDAMALILENEKDDGDGVVLVDTGSESGIGLGEARWKQWVSQHGDAPMTLAAAWNYHDGPVATRQSWAKEIKIGSLNFERVLVEEAQPLYTSHPNFEAIVGVGALYHYEVVIDGPGRMFYLKNHDACKAKFSYNRMGAVFIPNESGSYIARVVAHSPAQRAGLQDGDKLRNINGIEVDKSAQKILKLKQHLNASAGRENSFIVSRDNRNLTIKVRLEEIFPDQPKD